LRGLFDFSAIGYHPLMTNDPETKGEAEADAIAAARLADRGKRTLSDAEQRRRERAAAKLRENLARRKQQARARRAGEAEDGIGLPAARPVAVPAVAGDRAEGSLPANPDSAANSSKPGD
jgi:hypothetical protein